MSTVVGIDLGTSNSCVAYIKDGRPVIINDEEGRNTTPSIYAKTVLNEPLIGYPAKAQQMMNRLNTIFAVKRLIGRKFNAPEVAEATKKLPYRILPAENGDAWVEINGTPTSPEEVSSHVLVRMKEIAEHYLNERIFRAVITVPAHFNDSQRQATRDAGRIAGLDVLRIINEPTAAALAFGLNIIDGKDVLREDRRRNVKNRGRADRMIAVFDLGGGTFDISILELREGIFDVKATNGDTYLGGEDFDLAIVKYLLDEFQKLSGKDLQADRAVLQRFKEVAQKAKHDLSDVGQVEIDLPFVQGLEHMKVTLGRKQMETIVKDIMVRMEEPCLQCLDDARLTPDDITDVILVGGMTRMPAVKSCAARIFGREPLDTIDPDEAVALGAAVQAGLLQGYVKGVSLLDVTSLSLGIEIQGARTHFIIPRNTTVPTKKTEIFTTSAPNQPQVSIHVLQGESDFAPDNKSLGRFELLGIRPAPRGVPEIAVSFEIDAEGIVHVSAQDLDTGEEQTIEIIATSGLTDYEIDKLVREKMIEEEQRKRRESGRIGLVEFDESDLVGRAKNELKNTIFLTQAKLNTEGRGFKGRGRVLLEDSLATARTTLETVDEPVELGRVMKELEGRALALDEFIQSQW